MSKRRTGMTTDRQPAESDPAENVVCQDAESTHTDEVSPDQGESRAVRKRTGRSKFDAEYFDRLLETLRDHHPAVKDDFDALLERIRGGDKSAEISFWEKIGPVVRREASKKSFRAYDIPNRDFFASDIEQFTLSRIIQYIKTSSAIFGNYAVFKDFSLVVLQDAFYDALRQLRRSEDRTDAEDAPESQSIDQKRKRSRRSRYSPKVASLDEVRILSRAGQDVSEEPSKEPLAEASEQEKMRIAHVRAEHLDALLATVPGSAPYEEKAEKLASLNHEVRQRIATELAPVMNARIQAMPRDTYEEKKELARWVNEELRRFDLAIKGSTGQPSALVAVGGNPPDVGLGRLQLEHKSPEGKRVRTQLRVQLPLFELMEAHPRREALREWHEKVGRPRTGASRS